MQSWRLIVLAVALFLVCFVFYALFEAKLYAIDYHFIPLWPAEHTVKHFPHLIAVAAISLPNNLHPNKINLQKAANDGGVVLSVFKGREAKLNRAIMLTLFQKSPLIVYDVTKEVKKRKGFRFTKYSNVNRRVRALAQQGYLESAGSRNTQSGLQGTLYQPTIRAKVAFYLSVISLDRFVKEANDEALIMELAAVTLFLDSINLQK